ncbi:MAG: PseG/SpsG family protein [Nocardioidaceae bacterium]
MTSPISVAVYCDLGQDQGVGHAMRCLALSEEILRRGHRVRFVCRGGEVPWVADRIAAAGIEVLAPPDDLATLPATLQDAGADAVVFDSYTLPPEVYEQTREAGLPCLAFVDGDPRGASADLLLDQNLGAGPQPGGVWLVGLDFLVLRDEVLARRPERSPDGCGHLGASEPLKVLGFFGGTDHLGIGPVLAQVLVDTGRPFDATFVTTDAGLRERIDAVVPGPDQRLGTVGPTDRLADLVAAADLVLCGAGTSVWEVCALGRPAAVVCLADNQEEAYERLVDTGAVLGLGHASELCGDPDPVDFRRRLGELLADAPLRRRIAATGWHMIDGQGKTRVADALLALSRRP